jgi:indolepyruvate ferredoxin oxidoreductase beta subunit
MKKDIILAGVGGQGILSIAATIGTAALQNGLNLKQAEVHGMSQRGGAVQSHLRLSSETIFSDLIPLGKADLIISVEPMESLRYINMLSGKGWLITNIHPEINIPDYPDMDTLLDEIRRVPKHIAIDALKIAKENGSSKTANIVILGAASAHIGMDYESLKQAIKTIFQTKGDEIINMNLEALEAGRQFAYEYAKA